MGVVAKIRNSLDIVEQCLLTLLNKVRLFIKATQDKSEQNLQIIYKFNIYLFTSKHLNFNGCRLLGNIFRKVSLLLDLNSNFENSIHALKL